VTHHHGGSASSNRKISIDINKASRSIAVEKRDNDREAKSGA
jgi:hypothetical protein